MTINLKKPDIRELRPRITVFGVGGAGGNAVNNMVSAGLAGVEFVVANTDAQAFDDPRRPSGIDPDGHPRSPRGSAPARMPDVGSRRRRRK